MYDSTSHAVYPQVLVKLQDYPLLDLDVELFPESLLPLSNHSYDVGSQLVLDQSSSRTSGSAEAFSDCYRIQSFTGPQLALGIDQCHLPGLSAMNDLTVQSRSEIDNVPVRDDCVTLISPTIRTHASPGKESLCDLSGVSPFSNPIQPGVSEESTSLSQADCASPSQECYTLWKKIPVDASIIAGSNSFVPQTLYRPFTETDKQRYLERVSLSAPIVFMMKESLEWGISLGDVRSGKTQHLVDKEVPVLQDCGPSISIRINWPGYPPFKRQISSRNWRRMKGPITKEKLAQALATTTNQFILKMSNRQLEAGTEKGWKLGPQHIKVEDLILVSLHHVSKGSWQPQFRLQRSVT